MSSIVTQSQLEKTFKTLWNFPASAFKQYEIILRLKFTLRKNKRNRTQVGV